MSLYSVVNFTNETNSFATSFVPSRSATAGMSGVGTPIKKATGANTTATAGDQVYSFGGAHNLLETVWDASGRDGFDASGLATGVTLDLQPGHYSSIGTLGAASLAKQNVGIAYNTVIENATGGSGNDVIIGNDVGNVLIGGQGSDTMTGGDGADVFAFASGWGGDTITDFMPGVDRLDFDLLSIAPDQLDITDGAAGALIAWNTDSIVLAGISAIDLGAQDMLF